MKYSNPLKMLTMSTLGKINFYKRHKLFTEGRKDVNDDARPGCSSTLTTNEKVEVVNCMSH